MKAQFNYDLSEVFSLLGQSNIRPVQEFEGDIQNERRMLIQRAEEVVRKMKIFKEQFLRSQVSGPSSLRSRRVMRKV